MTKTRHWYVRRGTASKGPYPAGAIRRYVMLGRIRADDEVSEDQENWRAVSHFPAFYDPDARFDIDAERARLDERQAERRQSGGAEDGRRSGADRRQAESERVLARRKERQALAETMEMRARPRAGVAIAATFVIVAAAVIAAVTLKPVSREVAVDCGSAPGPGVMWDYCDKTGIDATNGVLSAASIRHGVLINGRLEGADLAGARLNYANFTAARLNYANLERADLTGSSLREADLRFARLAGANLSYADLRNVALDGADLDATILANAIWLDGRTCHPASRGACLID